MATPLLVHTWTTSVKNDTGSAVMSDSQSIAGSTEFNEKITVPAGATAEMDCGSLPYAKMVSLFLTSTVAVTVDTNAADGSGGQVISLAANKAWAWNNTLPTANPVTVNITKIYVTNAGTKDATFRCGFLMNQLI